MKRTIHILLYILLVVGLSACDGTDTEQTPTAEISMDDIHTAVVITLTADAANFSPTPQPTSTEVPTSTQVPSQTPVQKTATLAGISQGIIYSSGSSTANGCYDAVYVSDVTIPDGTEFAPGESFTKTWSLSNSGTCSWDDDFELVFVSGEDMDGEDTEIGDDVSMGYSISISVDMVAPTTEGTYYGYWRMADASGNLFGGTIYVMIVVTDDASTITATPTATDENDATSTPTSTSASYTSTSTSTTAYTSTTAPTSTSVPATSTPVPTEIPAAATESTDG
jgi:hypothetical protein